MKNYIIEASGGHLTTKRYIHPSGLLTGSKVGAERFELPEALRLIKLNYTPNGVRLKACYYTGIYSDVSVVDEIKRKFNL